MDFTNVINDNLELPPTFNKLNNFYTPVECNVTSWPPCVPNNCTKLSPNNSGEVPIEIRSAAKIGIDLNDKDAVQIGYAIIQRNFENEFDIAIINDLTGIFQIEFIGLLGNKISEFQLTKNRKAFNEIITTNLNSGIYFCILKINEQIIGSKKVLIIK
ncbi:MAG: hypothetical protein A2X64_09920 [Ignavibacteria bacterium GWF2_33_9]|nr:MAG: hypothetical protein A2X64_09920 [Ignavibacteria bacterium GWF2_33_9]